MELAKVEEIAEIFDFYKNVVAYMNEKGPRIGWNIDRYPDRTFVEQKVREGEMFLYRKNGVIAGAAVINHDVNPEYDDIDWNVKAPKEKLATIHALAISPSRRGRGESDAFLKSIEAYCKSEGDMAIHFDVIEGNDPALKLYQRNGYTEVCVIKMYYEVVGTRSFYMMEKVL